MKPTQIRPILSACVEIHLAVAGQTERPLSRLAAADVLRVELDQWKSDSPFDVAVRQLAIEAILEHERAEMT